MARPPLLPDTAILELIHELRGRTAALTGTQIRDELARRYGHRGGVARIYRLLSSAQAPSTPAPSSAASAELQEQLRQALERAERAEYREEQHQARWATEIHELREQVKQLRAAAQRLPWVEAELQSRSRELAAAWRRIADLEAQQR